MSIKNLMSINFDFKPGKFVHGDADKKIKIHHFDYGDIYLHIKRYMHENKSDIYLLASTTNGVKPANLLLIKDQTGKVVEYAYPYIIQQQTCCTTCFTFWYLGYSTEELNIKGINKIRFYDTSYHNVVDLQIDISAEWLEKECAKIIDEQNAIYHAMIEHKDF